MIEEKVMARAVELAAEVTVAWLSNPHSRATAEEVTLLFEKMHSAVSAAAHVADHQPGHNSSDQQIVARLKDKLPAAPLKDDLPAKSLSRAPNAKADRVEPAVSVAKSLASKDHIISLIDGKPYKTLRRHLSAHGLTPDEYRARYGLDAEYPMVSEAYSIRRREVAMEIGLGRKDNQKRSKR